VKSERVGESKPALRRDLGLLDAVGVGLGAIVGAGIFVVTGVAAGVAGPAFLVGLLIAGIAATANALSSAQLAAEYPQSGGTYEYGYRLLRPWAGFAAGWMFLVSKISAAATVGLGLGAYLEGILPELQPRVVAVVAIVAFTLLNYFGIRRSSLANLVIVTISIGSLVLFAFASAPAFDAANLRPFAPQGLRGILESAAILFFAYTGYARIATLGEEVREPRKTIPRAVVITIVSAIVIYSLVALVAVGTAGAAGLASTSAPLLAAAAESGHAWLLPALSIGGLAAMLGVILSQILGLSRMVFAMARRGDLPRSLAHIHAKHDVPDRAILIVGAIAAIVAATGTLRGVATAASFAILIYYGITNLAALRLPARAKLYPDLVPMAGLALCVVLAASLALRTILIGSAILAIGMLFRMVAGRRRDLT